MVTIGYHASHEQFAPSDLLTYAQMAEASGFEATMCSDHFHPWGDQQGESGFAWSWLGAAMQAVGSSFGCVCAPGQRYHPAIIAQAAATLAEMYPGRFWVALGSGQLLNEHITGEKWPTKPERNTRLKECVDIMRALWEGKTVTHRGLVTVEEAKLYTRPESPPQIIGAALTPETAEWVGGWADGMVTTAQPRDKMRTMIDAFRKGGDDAKPMFLQVQLSYAKSMDEARGGAWDQWRTNILPSRVMADISMPEQFTDACMYVNPEEIDRQIRVSNDLAQHAQWLREYMDMGFDRLYLHNVNRDQQRFIETFGERVLPELKR